MELAWEVIGNAVKAAISLIADSLQVFIFRGCSETMADTVHRGEHPFDVDAPAIT